jgi:hypothetical protein
MPRNISISVVAPASRKWFPGHWLSIGNSSGRRGTYHTGNGTSDLLDLPGVQGVQLRYPWIDLEPSPGGFNFGPVKTSYTNSERSIRADLWRCSQAGSQLMVMLEDKSFSSTNPMPTDLRAAQYVQANDNGGYTAARWNATVVARWGALIQAIGDAFDGHPNFYGIAFLETAIGYDATAQAATNYTAAGYRDAQIAQLQTASAACPTSRVFWYQNFMPTISQDFHLDSVADAIAAYDGGSRNNGILMGGPDILPDPVERSPGVYSNSVTERCQPRYREYFGEVDLFCSMQNDSYRHIHRTDLVDGATTPPDPRMPGYSWTVGSTWTMTDMFVFARDYLRLTHIVWNFLVAANGQEWEPHGRLVVAANPTFNTDL